MQIRNSSSLKTDSRVTSLSMGDSGKGKTFFAGTICDHGKPFFIDSEGGLKTVANKDFDYIGVNSWQEFLDGCAWYYNNHEERGYTHLVVDSFTRLQHYLMKSINDDGKLTQSQWGEVLASLRKVIDRLTKTCPTSLHVSAMAMESKDELSGGIKIYPNLQGAFKYDLAGYFDVVFYHDCGEDKGEQKYWVQTQGDQRITARSRLNSIKQLEKFEQNNYGIIANIFKGENNDRL
jgi:hypothetical protein